jgi:hypothetical protein
MPNVSYDFDFTASDLGFTCFGGQAGSYSHDAVAGAVKHLAGFSSTTGIRKDGITWEDLGVPSGKYVRWYDITLEVKTTGGSYSGVTPGMGAGVANEDGIPNNFSPNTRVEISQRPNYETVVFACNLYAVETGYQISTTPIIVSANALSSPELPGDDNYVFYKTITVTAYYEDTALDTQADLEISPAGPITLETGATQAFTVNTGRTSNFSVVEGSPASGTLSTNTGTSVTYTAPATPGTYTFRAEDFYCDCTFDTVTITVEEGAGGGGGDCDTYEVVIDNDDGNAPAAPELRLTVGGSGEVTLAATVTNETTGEAFSLDGTVEGGDIILVNTLEETVLIGAANRMDLFDGLFPLLALGENTFSVEVCSAVLTNLDVYWRSRWY